MASKHTYDVTIDGADYVVDSETPLTDEQAYTYAKSQVPFDVKKQNATMRANMAAQASAGKPESALESFAQAGPMGDVLEGMNAAHEGNNARAAHKILTGVGKVVAPAALPALAAAPAAVLFGAGGSFLGGVAGREGAKLVTDNPDYQDVAGDVGGLVGGSAGAKFGPPALRFAAPYARKAVSAVADSLNPDVVGLVSPRAGNAVRVAQRLNKVLTPATPKPPVVRLTRPTAAQTAADAEAARLAAAGVVPTAEAAASNPAIAAPVRARAPYNLPPEFQTLDSGVDEAVRAQVVPTADAAASSLHSTEMPPQNPLRRPYTPVPEAAPGDPNVQAIREILAERGGSGVNAQDFPTPAESLTPRRVNTPTFEQTGAFDARGGNESGLFGNPNAQDFESPRFMEPKPDPRANTPTFAQEGVGGRGNELGTRPAAEVVVPSTDAPTAVYLGEQEGVGSLYNVVGGPSGNSTVTAATLEKLGIPVPAKPAGLGATLSPEEQALIGNRGKGAATLAQRKALLDELRRRAAETGGGE